MCSAPMQSSLSTSEQPELPRLREFQGGLQYSQAQLKCPSQLCPGVLSPGPCATSGVRTAHPPSAPSGLEGALPSWSEPASPQLPLFSPMCV